MFLTKQFTKPANCILKSTLVVLVGILWIAGSGAQVPTAQQLEQLERLSPAQKQQLIRLLGGQSSQSPSSETARVPESIMPELIPEPESVEVEKDPVLKPGDSIVIDLSLRDDVQTTSLLNDVERSLGRNVFQLDQQGYVFLPATGKVLLAGLSAEEATLRLTAVSAFRELDVVVYLLPVEPTGQLALKPFGYDIFNDSRSSFTPDLYVPVPQEYVVGPGDEINLTIFGQQNAEYRLPVERDGQISIPEIGPITVTGMRFEQLRDEISSRVEQSYIGVNTSVTLGRMRTIQVFVLGDVAKPGSYSVNGLSTITNALYSSGGVSEVGSLRNVQLKRSNRVVARLDLYDMLLKGNTRNDKRLLPGDVIYVPPVGDQVSVHGEVKRPAIYEIEPGSTLGQVLEMAGGLRPSAYSQKVRLERFSDDGLKELVFADYQRDAQQAIKGGDQIEVQSALSELTDAVMLTGHVKRENSFRWRDSLRLLDVLPSAMEFKIQADQQYLLIRRIDQRTGRVQLLSANWLAAKNAPTSDSNTRLFKGDRVIVFSFSDDRSARIEPLIDELSEQATIQYPVELVSARGAVRAPGDYPFQAGMHVSDLLLAAGTATDYSYLENAEVTRVVKNGSQRSTEHLTVNLLGLVPYSSGDLQLQPEDVLTIKQIPLWREKRSVEINGEIAFPGVYTAYRGERLSEVVKRAGGLTQMAFSGGSVFLREDLKEREATQLNNLADRIRSEIFTLDEAQGEARERSEALLQQLESVEPVGRLVIDLRLALEGDPEHDVVLEDGDRLFIPPRSQEVTVIGEVHFPTSHIYEDDQDQFGYINRSGGMTRNADAKRVYVIRADGQVVAHTGGRWFGRSGYAISTFPGDTIVVPFDSDRISKLSLWSSASQIMYNIAVATAAVASF